MVKPFIAQEFVWRITAILRRTYKESAESSFLLNACKVDLEQAEVYYEGQEPVSLTAKEVEILKKLYANAGHIVTLGALCQTVCGDIYIGYEKHLCHTSATSGKKSRKTIFPGFTGNCKRHWI